MERALRRRCLYSSAPARGCGGFRLPGPAGFTLLELLVVLALFAVLVSLLVPAVQQVRAAGPRLQCAKHLHQIGLALHQYHDQYGSFPPGLDNMPWYAAVGPRQTQKYWMLSWIARLLPLVEQEALWRQLSTEEDNPRIARPKRYYPWDNARFAALGTEQPLFSCPADRRTLQATQLTDRGLALTIAFTAYLGVSGISHRGGHPYTGNTETWRLTTQNDEIDPTTGRKTGLNGMLLPVQNTSSCPLGVTIAQVHDGLSNTLMVGERPPSQDLIFGWLLAGFGVSGDGDGDVVLGISERNELNPFGATDPAGQPCSAGHADPLNSVAYRLSPGSLGNPCDQWHYYSLHPGGANFLLADGSVHFLGYTLSPLVQRALATRAGGEPVEVP